MASDFLLSVIAVIVLLGVLIFVHEMGHFLTAKFFNVGVLKFSLGFGRTLFGKKVGETEYVISMIPLGGYVKMLGESEVEGEELSPEEEKRSFAKQSVWKRMAIVFSGPLFNFVLAFLIFAVVFMIGVPTLTSEIGMVQDGGAASEAGLLPGDIVLGIDGRAVSRWDNMAERINQSGGNSLIFQVKRGNEVRDITVVPRMTPARNLFGEEIESYKIGVGPARKTVIERLNPLAALWKGVTQTWFITKMLRGGLVSQEPGWSHPYRPDGGRAGKGWHYSLHFLHGHPEHQPRGSQSPAHSCPRRGPSAFLHH